MITVLATLVCVAIVVLWVLSLGSWAVLHMDSHEPPGPWLGVILITLLWAGAFALVVLWGVIYS